MHRSCSGTLAVDLRLQSLPQGPASAGWDKLGILVNPKKDTYLLSKASRGARTAHVTCCSSLRACVLQAAAGDERAGWTASEQETLLRFTILPLHSPSLCLVVAHPFSFNGTKLHPSISILSRDGGHPGQTTKIDTNADASACRIRTISNQHPTQLNRGHGRC